MRIKLLHLIASPILFISLSASPSNVYSQIQAGSAARSRQSEHINYDERPFDTTLTRLPVNYRGVNSLLLLRGLAERQKNLLKDEFETTEEFKIRVQRIESEPLLGSVSRDSIVAFVTADIEAQYDADRRLMAVAVDASSAFKVRFGFRRPIVIRDNLQLDIPTARRTKSNLRALAVARNIFLSEYSLHAALLEVWFFDTATGDILLKRKYEAKDESEFWGPKELLGEAQKLYQEKRDEEALPLLRRVLTIEPTSAQSFLMIGRIQQRLGDQKAAISALKTAIFWESKTIDAHILLGRIFLDLGDRAQALTYARSAIEIDSNNQEAIGLLRQAETGGK